MNRIYTTVTGHRIEFELDPVLEAFLQQLEAGVADAQVSEQALIGLAYSSKNPLLDHSIFPGRGAVTKDVLANPAYDVMSDILFRKKVVEQRIDLEQLAAAYSMTVAEAAAKRGVHESAIRQAISAKRLASWFKDGRHYIDPRSLDTLEVGTRAPTGPKKKAPSPTHDATQISLRFGHAKGVSMKVRSDVPIEDVTRVGVNVLEGTLSDWKELVVMTTSEGGRKRAWRLVPDPDEEDVIEFDQFFVRGPFKKAATFNTPKSAEEAWSRSPDAR